MFILQLLISISLLYKTLTFCKHPPGMYCPYGSKYQLYCPQGHYCPENALFYKSCPEGTYLNETGMSNVTDCRICIPGYYCDRRGLDLPRGLCAKGYYCPEGSKYSTENICPSSHYCPGGSAFALSCPKGSYQNSLGYWHCSNCPYANITSAIYIFPVGHLTLECSFNTQSFKSSNIVYNVSIQYRDSTSNYWVRINQNTSRIQLEIIKNNLSSDILKLIVALNTSDNYVQQYVCSMESVCGTITKSIKIPIYPNNKQNPSKGTNTFYNYLYIIVAILAFVAILVFIIWKRKRNKSTGCSSNQLYMKASYTQNTEVINITDIENQNGKNEKENGMINITTPEINESENKTSTSECVNDLTLNVKDTITPYDVFVCYSSYDREWVKNTLFYNLELNGITVCIDFRDFLVGAFIVENITDAIYNSRKTIAVLSPQFLSSVYCKQELKQALCRLEKHQVIPVLYQPCVVPDILRHKTYLDWCHPDVQPHFWDLLVKAVGKDSD